MSNDLPSIRQAMLQSLEGGQFHVRERMAGSAQLPYEDFVQIGLALRACYLNSSRHDELIEVLKPHADVVIGTLPPGIQSHGLLPSPEEAASLQLAPKALKEFSAAQIRQWIVDDGSLVYGELSKEELERYFEALSPLLVPGAKFVDMGSGLGKVVMSAALHFPFEQCKGVEILPYRHRMASERFGSLLKVGQEGFASLMAQSKPLNPSERIALPWGNELKALHLLTLPNRIAFEQADMFDCDVSQANLVFIYSTCFGAFMGKIAQKLACEMPDASLVSTTTYALKHPAFKLIKHFPAKTMAWTDVFVYIKLPRIEGSEKWPAPEEVQAAGRVVDLPEWEAKARQMLALISPE
jgi:hypothetical protein